jgi:hypothetical protein
MGGTATSILLGLLALGLICAVAADGASQEKEDAEKAKVLAEVKKLLAESDSFKVIEYINARGEPVEVGMAYLNLAMDFYWNEKAVPEMVTIGRAGIQYCLTKAQDLDKDDPETAKKLRGIAKPLAYNLGAFTWPGWGDEGITLTATDIAAGFDAAKLDLRLAQELKRGPEIEANSYWLLGAHRLSAGQPGAALEAFETELAKAQEADDKAGKLLALGYIGIAKIVEGTDKDDGRAKFDEAVKGFEESGLEDADFFCKQLNDVLKFFTK